MNYEKFMFLPTHELNILEGNKKSGFKILKPLFCYRKIQAFE